MKIKTIPLIISTTLFASISSATPVIGGYNGHGGSLAASTSSVSGSVVNGYQSGVGYQSSGAAAHNTTKASASKTYTPNGVELTASTLSTGVTETYSVGFGKGKSRALAIQGGDANSNTSAYLRDYDRHGHYDHNSNAQASGGIGIESNSTQGSIAMSKVKNNGYSWQKSVGHAENDTSGYLTIDAIARHNKAKVKLSSGLYTKGYTDAFGVGVVTGSGTGFSGALANQEGAGKVFARGNISNSQYDLYRYRHRNHYHIRRVTTDRGTGTAKIGAKVKSGTLAVAGGTGNHYDGVVTYAGAAAENTAGVKNKIVPGAGKQKTHTTVETLTFGGGNGVGNSYGTFDAKAKGFSKAYGNFNGNVVTSFDYSNPTPVGCVARGGTGNCGIGNGLGGGNGIGNEGNNP